MVDLPKHKLRLDRCDGLHSKGNKQKNCNGLQHPKPAPLRSHMGGGEATGSRNTLVGLEAAPTPELTTKKL